VYLDKDDARFLTLQEFFPRHVDRDYESLTLKKVLTDKNQSFYLLIVSGMHQHTCGNKGGAHKSNNIYFHISRRTKPGKGTAFHLHQRCYDPDCKTYFSPVSRFSLLDDVTKEVLFPNSVTGHTLLKETSSTTSVGVRSMAASGASLSQALRSEDTIIKDFLEKKLVRENGGQEVVYRMTAPKHSRFQALGLVNARKSLKHGARPGNKRKFHTIDPEVLIDGKVVAASLKEGVETFDTQPLLFKTSQWEREQREWKEKDVARVAQLQKLISPVAALLGEF
jgi:hypothetical protein